MSKITAEKFIESTKAVEEFAETVRGFEKRNDAAIHVRDYFAKIKPDYMTILDGKSQAKALPDVDIKRATLEDVIKAKEDRDVQKYEYSVRLQIIDRVERQIAIGKTLNWEAALLDVFWQMDGLITGAFHEIA